MKNLTIADSDLREIIKIKKETRSNQYICDCIFCGKENHMYINRKTQMFDCKKCGESGSIYKLLKILDKLYLLGNKTVELASEIKSIREMRGEDETTITTTPVELPVKRMPVGWKPRPATPYLLNRGINTKICKRYKIGYTNISPRYKNYVLIPIYDNGEIRGYLGRYGDKKVPEGKLRYNNSLGTDFASLLFGYDDIIKGKTETVIITEGVFDKIAVDCKLRLDDTPEIKCVCTFGKKISDNQILKLLNKEIRNIVLCYDFDALKEIKSYGMELNMYFNTYAAVATQKKDIDECTEEEVLYVFDNIQDIRTFCYSVIGKVKH